MSLRLSLTCDCCGRELESRYTEPYRQSVTELKRDASFEGWKRSGIRENWFCNRCIARAKLLESEPKEAAS